MDRNKFESLLKQKISRVTFSGHRVNDDYSLRKRREIVDAAMFAFDGAASESEGVVVASNRLFVGGKSSPDDDLPI